MATNGEGGMISAPQPLAAEAGAEILAAGGNAVDAAVAAALVQGVVDPQMCGLGGGGSATVHDGASGRTRVLDFYARAPLAATPDMFADRIERPAGWGGFILQDRINEIGYLSVCTPAAAPGLGALHAAHGRLPWPALVEPAIAIAEAGAPVYHHVHERWSRQVAGYVDCITRHSATPACAAQYMRDGRMLEVGERMDTAAYAASLRRLAEAGPRDFVDGAVARAMVADFAAHGGLITLEDLARAAPVWREPVEGSYRGIALKAPPPPGGGVAVLSVLNILAGFDVGALRHNGAEHLDLLARALRLGLADWKAHTGDPDFVDNPVDWLLSGERADTLRAALFCDPAAPDDAVPDGRDTTHLSVIDGEGTAVSLTHTLALGSGVVTPELGFMYNDAMMLFDPRPGRPNAIAPGRVRQHAVSACLAFREGQPWLAVGAPGGHGIVSGVVQTISNLVDFGLGPLEAVSAPRIHCEGPAVELEARVPRAVAARLAAQGHTVRHSPYSFDFFAGRPHVVLRDPATGRMSGAADPRSGGMALTAADVAPAERGA